MSILVTRLSDRFDSAADEMVDGNDFQQPYEITCCGVYSMPFGLSMLDRAAKRTMGKTPEGFMLVYGVSVDPPKLPLEHAGVETSAVATLQHWLGYMAVGYC